MKIIKEEFLKDDAVSGFIEYLADLINADKGSFVHSYWNRQSKENWLCDSLQDALHQYLWKGKKYTKTKGGLDKLKIKLDNSFESNDENGFKETCHDILKWGGVLQHNTKWLDNKLCSKNGLIKSFDDAKSILTQEIVDINSEDWNKPRQPNTCNYRMNAGYTKIYSLLCDDFIIYDSRVAATLGKLVVEFLLENKNKNYSNYKNLEFRVMPAKEEKNCKLPKNRNPSRQDIIKFKGINNKGFIHAEWNVKANWILAEAVKQADMQWKDEEGNKIKKKDGLRALEAALFMIGYDLSDAQITKESSKKRTTKPIKGKLPKVIKQRISTKKKRAVDIFNKHKTTKSRAEIIKLFINEADLTKAGANTYYQNCKSTWT